MCLQIAYSKEIKKHVLCYHIYVISTNKWLSSDVKHFQLVSFIILKKIELDIIILGFYFFYASADI